MIQSLTLLMRLSRHAQLYDEVIFNNHPVCLVMSTLLPTSMESSVSDNDRGISFNSPSRETDCVIRLQVASLCVFPSN